jgi:signal transduction histidine kinase
MIKKLMLSKKETEVHNDNLTIANRELDKFVYSASHDLRSPITSLKGLIEITREENDLEQIKEYLQLMHQSLTKQDQFISDIIDYSRNKRKQLSIEIISLSKLIDDCISQHQHIKNADTIAIRKNITLDEISTDCLRLKIILNNLISNAIKYSDPEKKKQFITIKTYEDNGFCKIDIEDNGIGIKDEFSNKIFEMFFVTNNNMGSGLGLYIAKEAAENLKGNITVTSETNVGSTFTVSLPKYYEI